MDVETEAPVDAIEASDAVEDEEQLGDARPAAVACTVPTVC